MPCEFRVQIVSTTQCGYWVQNVSTVMFKMSAKIERTENIIQKRYANERQIEKTWNINK